MILAAMPTVSRERDVRFEELFRQLYRPVLHFLARQGCSPEECNDLAQETFLRAHRSFETFRGDAKASTWLFGIALNVWRNKIRDRKAGKRAAKEVPLSVVDHAPPDPGGQALDATIRGERLRLLKSAVADLPPQMQRCVLLRVYQDRSFRDVAEIVGVSESTAKSQVSLARSRLRELLSEHYPDLEADLAEKGA